MTSKAPQRFEGDVFEVDDRDYGAYWGGGGGVREIGAQRVCEPCHELPQGNSVELNAEKHEKRLGNGGHTCVGIASRALPQISPSKEVPGMPIDRRTLGSPAMNDVQLTMYLWSSVRTLSLLPVHRG